MLGAAGEGQKSGKGCPVSFIRYRIRENSRNLEQKRCFLSSLRKPEISEALKRNPEMAQKLHKSYTKKAPKKEFKIWKMQESACVKKKYPRSEKIEKGRAGANRIGFRTIQKSSRACARGKKEPPPPRKVIPFPVVYHYQTYSIMGMVFFNGDR